MKQCSSLLITQEKGMCTAVFLMDTACINDKNREKQIVQTHPSGLWRDRLSDRILCTQQLCGFTEQQT